MSDSGRTRWNLSYAFVSQSARQCFYVLCKHSAVSLPFFFVPYFKMVDVGLQLPTTNDSSCFKNSLFCLCHNLF